MDHDKRQYQCDICGKVLSRNQRLQTHKLKMHGILPDNEIKQYKLYTQDPDIPIPRTTAFRKRKFENNESHLIDETSSDLPTETICTNQVFHHTDLTNTYSDSIMQDHDHLYMTRDTLELQQQTQNVNIETDEAHEERINNAIILQTMNTEFQDITEDQLDEHEEIISNYSDSDHVSDTCSLSSGLNSLGANSDLSSDSESDGEKDSDFETSTDSDSASENNDEACVNSISAKNFTEDDEKNMALLSFVLRHHLGGNGSRNMLKIIKIFNPNYNVQDLNTLKEVVGSADTQVFHFCEKCFTMFPQDGSVFQCTQIGCDGLRYKQGSLNKQHLKRKKSYFTCLLLNQQIEDILQRDGVWDAITKYRLKCAQSDHITDILNADAYKELCKPGNFMDNNNNLTLMFNTDGVPLFKSSGVSIWPVYIVINELPH